MITHDLVHLFCSVCCRLGVTILSPGPRTLLELLVTRTSDLTRQLLKRARVCHINRMDGTMYMNRKSFYWEQAYNI